MERMNWIKKSNKTNWTNKGFTLLEILIVLAIIGLASLSGVFIIASKFKQARDAERRTEIHEIQIALEAYFIDHQGYPDNLLFGSGGLVSDDGQTTYLEILPQDPLNQDPYLYVYNASPGGNPTSYDICAYRLEAETVSFCLTNRQ